MRRVTSALVAAGCLYGSAFAQPGSRPPAAGSQFRTGGQFQESSRDDVGRLDARSDFSSQRSMGLPSRAGSRDAQYPAARFDADADLRSSASRGFGQQVDNRSDAGSRPAAEPRTRDPLAGLPAAHDRGTADRAFDPATGGLTAEGRAELMLRNRLAAIDRLRNAALEVGDTELLREADRLQQQARAQLQMRRPVAGPSQQPVRPAEYEFDPTSPAGVTPAGGHPISGFEASTTGQVEPNPRGFGIQPGSAGRLSAREPGAEVPARAPQSATNPGATIPVSGQRIAGEWYDVQNLTPARAQQPADVSTRYGARIDSAAPAADEFNRPQFPSGFGATQAPDRGPEPNPFAPREDRTREAPRYEAGTDTAGTLDYEAAARAFDRQLAAESRLDGQREFPSQGHPLRAGHDQGNRPSAPGVRTEDENTIYFGRPSRQASAADFGPTAAPPRGGGQSFGPARAAAARAAAAEFDPDPAAFGQTTAAEARTAGREFGQATAADARTAGREFGQRTAADSRAWKGESISESTGLEDDGQASSQPLVDESSTANFETELNARRDQAGPSDPSAPSRAAEKPRKRGLFSWFRGLKKDESR